MVKLEVEFWWKCFWRFSPAKEARKSPSKFRRKFATNFAENFANFTLEIAGAYFCNGGSLNSPWNYNSHETTTLECSTSTSWGPKAVTAVKWRLLHPAIIERQQFCTHNSRQTTKSPSQQPWNDESGTQQGAWDFASFHGCCRFKCLLGISDVISLYSYAAFRVSDIIFCNSKENLTCPGFPEPCCNFFQNSYPPSINIALQIFWGQWQYHLVER